MNSELIKIINLFNKSQENAIEKLENDFDCPRPKDSMDYILRCVPIIRELNYSSNGITIKPHGIGMMINTGKEKIDFDFGKNGEFNGFDAYRLANYIRLNKIKTELDTEEKMKRAFNKALERNSLVEIERNAFYLLNS